MIWFPVRTSVQTSLAEKFKMVHRVQFLNLAASSSVLVAEAILEDKLADIWPDYPCLYDVRSADFRNRDLREKALQEMAEKLETTCKI